MADAGACSSCRQCCTAGVRKQIEDSHRLIRLANQSVHIIPVCRLLRKQTGVLKVHRLDVKREFAIMNVPLRRQLFDVPLAAAGGRAMIRRICGSPSRNVFLLRPDCLRVRTNQHLLAPALYFFAIAAVEHFKIFPFICNPHMILLLSMFGIFLLLVGFLISASAAGTIACARCTPLCRSVRSARWLRIASATVPFGRLFRV